MKAVIGEADFEWLMIDASHAKAHPPRGGSGRRQSGDEPDKRGLNANIHVALDAHGGRLTGGINAEVLPADGGYDTDTIVSRARAAEMQVMMPPKKNRKVQREYGRDL